MPASLRKSTSASSWYRDSRKINLSAILTSAFVVTIFISPSEAANCVISPGVYNATINCIDTGSTTFTMTGPSTVTIPNGAGTNDGIRVEVSGNAGSATATVSDVTVVNNDTTNASIALYVLLSSFSSTGSATLNLSGSNSFTTANGTTVEVNNRGSGHGTMNITGTINVTSLITNTDDNDGIETTVRGGRATINMGGASGVVSVRGGNGILIDSLTAGGIINGTIGSGMTINLDNTIAGANGALNRNSGIYVSTLGTGTIDLVTGATINTSGTRADGIRADARLGQVNITNSGNITTSGTDSHGIDATTSTTNNAGGAISINNSGAIRTSATANANGILVSTSTTGTGSAGSISISNSNSIATAGTQSHGIAATSVSTGAGAAGAIQIINQGPIAVSGANSDGIRANQTGTTIGNTSVSNAGPVAASGNYSLGIFAFGNATDVTIGAGGGVSGGWQSDLTSVGLGGVSAAGVALGSRGIGTTLTNQGMIGALSDRAVVELDRFAIGASGPLTLVNNGTITGFVEFGAGAATFQNLSPNSFEIRHFADTNGDGIRDTKRVAISDFGAGVDTFLNETNGTVRLGAVAGAATTDSTGYYVPTTGIDSRPLDATFYDFAREGLLQGQLVNLETFSNAGTIDLRGIAVGNTLIITGGPGVVGGVLQPGTGTYVSNGGQLLLNTVLNDGIPPGGQSNSFSDMLVVDSTQLGGGGPTRIQVTPAPASSGALTLGNGIELVEVHNKTASAAGAFVLGQRVASGAFEYTLHQGGVNGDAADGNWYLRSTIEPLPPTPPEPPAPPSPIPIPDFREEVPVDMVVPALANRLGLAMLGSYHDRIGEDYVGAAPAPATPRYVWCKDPVRNFRCLVSLQAEPYSDAEAIRRFAGWGRVFGETGSVSFGNRGGHVGLLRRFYQNGPAYEYDLGGFQTGMDLYRAYNPDGTRDIAGLFVGLGRIESDVRASYGGPAGSTSMNGYSIGAYWTRKGTSGWYIDGTIQGTIYDDIRARSIFGEVLKTNGWGFAASVEGGYPIALGSGFAIEPQAQLVYQHTSIDGSSDRYGSVSYDDTDAVYARLGARLTKGWTTAGGMPVSVWARGNVWHSFAASGTTTFAAPNGLNPIDLKTSLGGTWGQVGLGVSGKLASNVSVFGTGDYNFALGRGKGTGLGGRVGIKVIW